MRLKYIIVIPDGGADFPLEQLGGKTAFQAAHTPHLDALASKGRLGVAKTTPPGFEAGSDVCSMSLLGYDPAKYHTGRAPLEAASLGLQPGSQDCIFRLNLVTTGASTSGPYSASDDALMIDHSAGAITDAEARSLIASLVEHWKAASPAAAKSMVLTPGVSYRNILIDSSGRSYADVITTPPHAVPGESWRAHLPKCSVTESKSGAAGLDTAGGVSAVDVLRDLMLASRDCFRDHPINKARIASGKRPATMAWIWGQGVKPSMPAFQQRFGIRGSMITAVDLLSGIAAYMGWDRLDVPGVTSYHDTDYAAQGRAAVEAVTTRNYDIVCCHVEAPDEASHQADWKTKVAAIEAIDRHVVAPISDCMSKLDSNGHGCRVLVMPDHYTLVSTRKHDATPVPFLLAGAGISSNGAATFDESAAAATGLVVQHGHDLMSQFLGIHENHA
ncbi:MAG: cofactor-independent phosphoglycerate mutase [Phycisphaerae bacterium]|nr:cofactor-independent phosphoglycerate mutase [Phycisphaerae bacterium]